MPQPKAKKIELENLRKELDHWVQKENNMTPDEPQGPLFCLPRYHLLGMMWLIGIYLETIKGSQKNIADYKEKS